MAYDKDVAAGNLRALRARRRMTQQEVADAIGVNVNTITNYENGDSGISYENAWRLADLYGIPLCEIGGRDERGIA